MPVNPNSRSMLLENRAAELASLVAKTRVTDTSGDPIDTEGAMGEITRQLCALRSRRGGLFLAGNGGSAAVASHAQTDFVNVASLRAHTLHEPALLTCMTNDYGYESAFARILEIQARPEDKLIAISSSGNSMNIRNAADKARKIGGGVITLSGFKEDNPLRSLGDLNIWLDSDDYGLVEVGHLFILHNIADRMRLGL